jgi:hypothetical protein
MIFGDKNKFAIEIEQGITCIKGYMCLWFQGILIGDKKRQCEFIHAIFDFRKFYRTKELLYEQCFSKMSAKEIFEYVLAEDLVFSNKREDLEEAQRRQIYIRFLGDQFDNNYSFISVFNENTITWIIWKFKNQKDEYISFEIPFEDFEKVSTDFTDWFNLNLADRHPSYVP